MRIQTETQLPIRILTHNVRYATTAPFKNERPWPERLPKILSELRFHTLNPSSTFICLQEALHHQLLDIIIDLNRGYDPYTPDWAFIGVGRDNGQTKGEYSAILYRPSVWKVIDWKTTWLSETPTVPSKGWDAASVRILTTGIFAHRETGKRVIGMSTHLDDQGELSRYHAANMILEEISKVSQEYRIPTFLAGDFNSEDHDRAYQHLNNPNNSRMIDLRMVVDCRRHYGNHYTFTGFGDEDGPPSRIDYVFAGPRESMEDKDKDNHKGWNPKNYGVLDNGFDDKVLASDHRAVVVDLVLI
jgi:endonuclease/exonuclease/phosphatase family metal-dependent hydrolase